MTVASKRLRQWTGRNYFLASHGEWHRNPILFALRSWSLGGTHWLISGRNPIEFAVRTSILPNTLTSICHAQIPNIALKITCRTHGCNYTHVVHWLSVPNSCTAALFSAFATTFKNIEIATCMHSRTPCTQPTCGGAAADTEEGEAQEIHEFHANESSMWLFSLFCCLPQKSSSTILHEFQFRYIIFRSALVLFHDLLIKSVSFRPLGKTFH